MCRTRLSVASKARPFFAYRPFLELSTNQRLSCVRAIDDSKLESEKQTNENESIANSEERDFWEGESWEIMGKVAYFALPALIALAVGIGLFAANTYNNGADIFLESAKSDSTTAQLYSFE